MLVPPVLLAVQPEWKPRKVELLPRAVVARLQMLLVLIHPSAT